MRKGMIKILFSVLTFSAFALAQDLPKSPEIPAAPEATVGEALPPKAEASERPGNKSGFQQKSEEETLDVPRNRKFIYLTIGVEYDEKTREMPPAIVFKGDYKKVSEASYDKETLSVHFVPKREGTANLSIKDKKGKVLVEYRLIVRKSKLEAVAREIQSLLADVEGITIRILNNKVIVDGQVLIPGDLARVLAVVAQFGEQASSLVVMSPMVMKKIAELIAKEINSPEIEVEAKNDKIILKGKADSEGKKASYELIAKSYMPPIIADPKAVSDTIQKKKPLNEGVINLIEVSAQSAPPPAKMIQVILHYVELSKDYQKSFRFQFMPNIGDQNSNITFSSGGQGNAGGASSQFTATINQLFPKLNWAKSHSHARVLEAGTVQVKDGEEAKFSRTTKMPTSNTMGSGGQIAQGGGETIGITTTVKPTTTGESSNAVDLNLDFQIMAPGGSTGTGLIVSTNSIKTQLVVQSGMSAAIGGLISNDSVTGFNKLPTSGVSDNPIISLYTSRDFSHKQSQFVVFVTPMVRGNSHDGSEKLKKKFKLDR